jgi:hypothetical protein
MPMQHLAHDSIAYHLKYNIEPIIFYCWGQINKKKLHRNEVSPEPSSLDCKKYAQHCTCAIRKLNTTGKLLKQDFTYVTVFKCIYATDRSHCFTDLGTETSQLNMEHRYGKLYNGTDTLTEEVNTII